MIFLNKGVNHLTDRQAGLVFDKRQTNIAKGVALLLLLWHHLFYNDPKYYNRFTSLYNLGGVPIECYVASFCKVCVAVFLLLSGYGLVKSYSNYSKIESDKNNGIKKTIKYVFNHLIKLLSDYWFVYIIFVPLGLVLGRSFLDVYGTNPIHYITDFFGVSFLFFNYSYTMNATWWFMSIIILFYIIFPVLYRLLRYSPELLLVLSVFVLFCPLVPNSKELKTWLCPFVVGMYMA